MPTATLTSKGQITVPKSVRDDLGLVPGSQVSFRHVADGRYELVVDHRRATDLLGSIVPDFAIEDEAQVSRALDSALDGADLPDALLHEAALAAGVDVVTFDKAAAKRFGWHLLASNDDGSGSDAQ